MGVATRLVLVKKNNQKEKGKRSSTRPKRSIQSNTITRSYFINKPLSNHDLTDWVKQLGIKYFRGVFSKDMLRTQIKNKECGIVNLDNHIGAGTHWVCYRNIDRFCEYFDSFGLPMPIEVKKYMKTSGKNQYIQQMRYKNVIQYYAVIGVCTICWKDRREEAFLIQYIIVNLICQIQVLITDSSSITSKTSNIYV